MPESTRDRLIQASIRRFYRDGFRSVGIDQVLADVGISKTAFYKHFESKEDLMLAGLEAQNFWLQNTFRTMVEDIGGASAIGQLHALMGVVETIIESDDFHGCIFVNASMEFPLPHEPAHVLAAKSKTAIEEFIRGLAKDAGADDPHAMAQEICLIIEGAYVTRHVSGKPDITAIAGRLVDAVIASRCPSSAEAPVCDSQNSE